MPVGGLVMADKETKQQWQPVQSPDGMFFCEACLRDLPLSERSNRDVRYCNFCQPIIEEEYLMLAERKGRPLYNFYRPITLENLSPISEQGGQNMSTLENTKITVDIIRPRIGKRGPKKMKLPDDEIKQLHKDGMGAKAIATHLKREHGIEVSYKTIQRLLSGERRCESL